jgi:hypothetical protein
VTKPPAPPKPPPPPAKESPTDKNSRAINTDYGVTIKETPVTPIPDSNKDFGLITPGAMDYSFLKEAYNTIRMNHNVRGEIYTNIRLNQLDRFNRYKVPFSHGQLSKGIPYIFFVRPDINILNDSNELTQTVAPITFYSQMYKTDPEVFKSLTKNLSSDHSFHPYLSNAAMSFELSDELIKTEDSGETFTGYKMKYARSTVESNTAGTFSIQYVDDRDLNVYKTHKLWLEYMDNVYRGVIQPGRHSVLRKEVDYSTAVYYFLCGPDGETLLFWSKYFGVFPNNAPASSLSWAKGSSVKLPEFSINYSYSVKEDYKPIALMEFNELSKGSFEYRRTYEPSMAMVGRTMAGAPFIQTSSNPDTGRTVYKLRFRK